MAKPTTITTWATDAGATADPGATRRATGFVPGKKLPSKWLNWILNQNGAWLTYLRDLHTEIEFLNKAYFWRGRHSFVVPGGFGNLTTTRAVRIAAGRLEYVDPLDGTTVVSGDTRVTALRLGLAKTNFVLDDDTGQLVLINQANVIPRATFELELPSTSVLQGVSVDFTQNGLNPGSDVITLEIREVLPYGIGAVNTVSYPADSGTYTVSAPNGGALSISSASRYQFRFLGVYKSFSTAQTITAGSLTWLDPGARNT